VLPAGASAMVSGARWMAWR